jgi:hypothetical protein
VLILLVVYVVCGDFKVVAYFVPVDFTVGNSYGYSAFAVRIVYWDVMR